MRRNTLLHGKRCLSLAMAFVICSSLPAYAIEAPPDAGAIADSVKEHKITIPPKANIRIEVNGEQEEASPQKEGYKIKVSGFHITGQRIYSEDKLQALVKDAINQELTLTELKAVARRITQYYRERGYIVAKAYIPAQDIKDGSVEIAFVPGRYGSMEIRNHSRLSDSTARKLLSPIKIGDYVQKDALDRALLLLSDTGGISIKASLGPGKTTGTSNLIVEINNADTLTADLSMDNYGNRFTGQNLRNLDLDAYNVSGIGDQVNLNVNNSGGDLTNVGGSYTMPIGGQGLRLKLGYEQLHYSLGQDFEALDAYGTAKSTSVYGSYPLIRSRNYNLYAGIGYNHKQLEDHIDEQATFTNRHTNVWTLGLSGDKREEFQGGSISSFALTLTSGRLTIDGGQISGIISAQENDRLGAQTAGNFTKANMNLNCLQYINSHMNAYLGLTGQLASKNLDSSEKFYLGGAYGVRAYPQGEASGDRGYLLTGELRYQLPNPSVQLTAFVDYGHVDGSKNYYAASADNRRLAGAGLGVIFSSRKDYTVRLDYAWKLTSDPAISDTDKHGRLWLRGVSYY